jgi:membrane protein DedA with SNARE-associated domain
MTVIFSRFVGFATGQVNFLAGLTRTPIRSFLAGDIFGNVICVAIYVLTGYIAARSGYSLPGVAAILGGVLIFFAMLSFVVTLYIEKKSSH